MEGKVKLYSLVKGSGMIIGEDGKEYKVKMDSILGTGLRKLSEGQSVNFVPEGAKATEVEPA